MNLRDSTVVQLIKWMHVDGNTHVVLTLVFCNSSFLAFLGGCSTIKALYCMIRQIMSSFPWNPVYYTCTCCVYSASKSSCLHFFYTVTIHVSSSTIYTFTCPNYRWVLVHPILIIMNQYDNREISHNSLQMEIAGEIFIFVKCLTSACTCLAPMCNLSGWLTGCAVNQLAVRMLNPVMYYAQLHNWMVVWLCNPAQANKGRKCCLFDVGVHSVCLTFTLS